MNSPQTPESSEAVEISLEQAKQIAFDAVKTELDPEYRYKIRVEEENDRWRFVILPEGRVRGGGAKVTVSKAAEIIDIIYLQ
jgi:hypothetical protein